MPNSTELLSERLSRLRAAAGLTITEVATELGISPSTYREWEAGRAIRGEPYVRLAEIFDVSLGELLIGEHATRQEILRDLRKIEGLLDKIKLGL